MESNYNTIIFNFTIKDDANKINILSIFVFSISCRMFQFSQYCLNDIPILFINIFSRFKINNLILPNKLQR